MQSYVASGSIAVAATKTALVLGSTAAVRPRILAFNVSTDGTPTSDQGLVFNLQRCTALGTSTAVTPSQLDPSDPASVFTAGSNCSVEPTYTAGGVILAPAINPRATWQWAAYDQRSELILPATAANGAGFQIQAAGGAAGNFRATATVQN